jgi:ABC-type glutathione transport system ATPase component
MQLAHGRFRKLHSATFQRELSARFGVHRSMERGPAPAAIPVIEARALAKRYGGFRAVRDVSFSVRGGELLGVVGAFDSAPPPDVVRLNIL